MFSRHATIVALLIVGAFSGGLANAEIQSLLEAAKAGTAADLQAFLSANADPNEADADGTSALHWTVHRSDIELTQALLRAGAAVDQRNRYGVRPTFLAAENGDAAMMNALLEAGADPNAIFAEGETVLMTAARTGNVATIETLIAAGADVNATEDRGGQTALMWAAAENNGPAVTALIEAGAEIDALEATGEFTALAFAARIGAVEGASALLDAGADVDATLLDGTSILMLAIHNANFEMASALLDYGADPNIAAQGRTALHEIARVRRWNRGFNLPGPEHDDDVSGIELAHELVAHGANVNAPDLTERPDGEGNTEISRGPTPFLQATRSLDLPYMHTLLDLGADPTFVTDDGTTAVMIAAGVGQGLGSAGSAPGSVEEALAAVELTLELGGGTVNDLNANNETPLHGALYRGGSIALIDLLVERGADLEGIVNSRGWTPLRIADGIALDGIAFIRYPEAATHLRELMRARGLPVPPVVWDGPAEIASE